MGEGAGGGKDREEGWGTGIEPQQRRCREAWRGGGRIVKYRRQRTRPGNARRLGLLPGLHLPYPNKLSIAVSSQLAALRPIHRTNLIGASSVSPSASSLHKAPAVCRPPVPSLPIPCPVFSPSAPTQPISISTAFCSPSQVRAQAAGCSCNLSYLPRSRGIPQMDRWTCCSCCCSSWINGCARGQSREQGRGRGEDGHAAGLARGRGPVGRRVWCSGARAPCGERAPRPANFAGWQQPSSAPSQRLPDRGRVRAPGSHDPRTLPVLTSAQPPCVPSWESLTPFSAVSEATPRAATAEHSARRSRPS